MGKPTSDFAIMADELKAIRQELADLKASVAQPTQPQLRARAILDKEVPDPCPVEIPGEFSRPDTIQELIQKYVHTHISTRADELELGTFEEEDDFREDDVNELDLSGYEIHEYEMEDDPDMPPPFDPDPVDQGEQPSSAPPPADASEAPQETTPPIASNP